MSKRVLSLLALAAVASLPALSSAHDEPVIGTLAGAGIGAAVAGPPGAAVGAVIGAIIGATEAHESDHGANAHPHRHYGGARFEPVRYSNGSTQVYCEPARGVVRTKVVTKTKMKKVCRYEPVRTSSRVVVATR
jgi:outer membrane lipoprotein SlyB